MTLHEVSVALATVRGDSNPYYTERIGMTIRSPRKREQFTQAMVRLLERETSHATSDALEMSYQPRED